jgi:V/A-type H+-transporting ATPase subunit A
VAAISPPGGDLSEPVTQATLRVAGALWALDPALAQQRQFPAVDWAVSYSLQAERITPWFDQHVGDGWSALRRDALDLLQRGRELRDIASLVGPDALQDADRLTLESARDLQELLLGQSAYDPADAFSPPRKTLDLANLALTLHARALGRIQSGSRFDQLEVGSARRAMAEFRSAPFDEAPARLREAEAAVALGGARPGS